MMGPRLFYDDQADEWLDYHEFSRRRDERMERRHNLIYLICFGLALVAILLTLV